MVDLPIGKALVAVLSPIQCDYKCEDDSYDCPYEETCCQGCFFDDENNKEYYGEPCGQLSCETFNRRDGKKVIFRMIDNPVE